MPQLRGPGVERLTLPSDPEAWVEMKIRASYGDRTAAQEAMVNVSMRQASGNGNGRGSGRRNQMVMMTDQASGQQMLTEFETAAYFLTLLARVITDWNFTDERGTKLPITRANLELLDFEDGEFLEAQAKLRMGGRPGDQQGPSKTPSLASSSPMAAGPATKKPPAS